MYAHHYRRYAPPPVTPHTVSRDRLYQSLEAGSVVLVLGAAGYGKSTLLSSWLRVSPRPGVAAWLALEPAHADSGRLTGDLLAALRAPAAGSLGEALAGLEAPPVGADHLSWVDSVHQALHDAETPLTLVIDDVQNVAHAREALAVLEHFVLWAPASTRVVIASRSMPALKLHRLRLEERLTLIDHADLAFTEGETAAAVAAWDVDVAPDVLAELHALTQGWPAAVRMAVLAMRASGRRDLPGGLRRDDVLASYLTTEVLEALDPELGRFVVDATVDELVCASLLDEVRGAGDSAALLERCVEEGLFLSPEAGGGGERWYRWHALFASYMRVHRLESPDSASEVERRAALWWRFQDPDRAVTHALAAHLDELAGEIVASSWLDLVLAGRADTARRMAAAVPDGVRSAAELHLARAWVATQRGALDVAGAELAAARRVSGRLEGAAAARFEVRAAVIDLFVVRNRSALRDSVVRGGRLLEAVESGAVDVDVATRAMARLYLGMSEARLLDDPLEAVRLLRLAGATADDAGFTALGLAARAEACIPSILGGDLDETAEVATRVVADADAKGWVDLPGTATAYGYLGWLALWRGDARRARKLLQRCIDDLLPNDWGMLGLATAVHAQACLSAGDVDGAQLDGQRGRGLAARGQMAPWWPSLQRAIDAMVLVAQGRLDEAETLTDSPADGPEFHLATCFRAVVQLLAARPDRALEIIDTIPPARFYPHVAGTVHAVRAQAHVDLGNRTAAHGALERALECSQTHGFLEPFRLVGTRLIPLLTEHLHTGTRHRSEVTRVVARLTADLAPAEAEWGETLTARERSILSFLATDLSHGEIAEAESISVNTVKTHVAHVFRKLEVTNRRSAVRRAAELGLL